LAAPIDFIVKTKNRKKYYDEKFPMTETTILTYTQKATTIIEQNFLRQSRIQTSTQGDINNNFTQE
jgi:hypothetical protein